MKTIIAFFLLFAICFAEIIRPREPQTSTGTSPSNNSSKGSFGNLSGIYSLLGTEAIGILAQSILPPAKLSKVERLRPQLRPTARRIRSRYGPYILQPRDTPRPKGSLDPNGQANVELVMNGICKYCSILAGSTGLVFEDGSPVDPATGIYAHHIITSDISKKGILPVDPCDYATFNASTLTQTTLLGVGFLGQGEDSSNSEILFTNPNGSFQSGFLVGWNDRFALLTDIVNNNNETKSVYVTMETEYVDGHVGADAMANLLSVTGCNLEEPKVNKTGPAEIRSMKFPVLVDGEVIGMKGYMHNGGDRMILYINGKEVCTSKSRYGPRGISGMSTCDKTIPVKKGDWLEMLSVYDLSKHPLRSGAVQETVTDPNALSMWGLTFVLDSPQA